MAKTAPRKKDELAIPKTLGACADLLWDMQQRRYDLQHQAEAIEKDEAKLKEHIIANVPKGDTGASGKHHRVTVETKPIVKVEDWEKVYAYVRKNNDFSLLQRRIGEARLKEIWDDGKKVPGVVGDSVAVVRVNKI